MMFCAFHSAYLCWNYLILLWPICEDSFDLYWFSNEMASSYLFLREKKLSSSSLEISSYLRSLEWVSINFCLRYDDSSD
jgi:hypothetical protein